MKLFDNYDKQLKDMNTTDAIYYICGPTVYNYIHIGNARPMIVFDVFFRIMKRLSNNVTYISNFTDVDDKIIKKAIEEGVSEKEISEKYMAAFENDRENLNVLQPTEQPKVTDYMDEIITYIKRLEDAGAAYAVDGDVFFRTKSVKDYGKLSNKNIDELLESDDVIASDKKEHPTDFVLWKNTGPGIKWPSPWGEGRPGWHTECVVMIEQLAKRKLDMHGGGVDLKFPHHENEIAQSIAADGHTLANIWSHNGHISIDGEKMSKSLGNFILVKDILNKVSANVLRLLMIKSSYSSPINFSDELVESSTKEWEKIEAAMKSAAIKIQLEGKELPTVDFKTENELVNDLVDNLKNNLNTPNAVSELIKLSKTLNNAIRQNNIEDVVKTYEALEISNLLLGFKIKDMKLDKGALESFKEWNKLKKEKNYEEADKIRNTLVSQGWL